MMSVEPRLEPKALTKLRNHYLNVKCSKWFFDNLFENDDNVALLNETAPHDFGLVQRVFADSILLGLARMGDRSRRSLSVWHASAEITRGLAADHVAKIEVKRDAVLGRLLRVREHRDKRIAHFSRRVAVDELALTPVRLEDVKGSFSLIDEWFHCCREALGLPHFHLDWAVGAPAGQAILNCLRSARVEQKVRRAARRRMGTRDKLSVWIDPVSDELLFE